MGTFSMRRSTHISEEVSGLDKLHTAGSRCGVREAHPSNGEPSAIQIRNNEVGIYGI